MVFVLNIEAWSTKVLPIFCLIMNISKSVVYVYYDYPFSWEGMHEGDFVNQIKSLSRHGKGGC